MIGTGYQHAGLCLSISGAQHLQRGVFVKTSRSPILTMENAVNGPLPPSLREFVDSGRLLSDPVYSMAAITNGGPIDSTRSAAKTNLDPQKLRNF